ncbi:MAG: hypothetical protein WC011_02925 [Candidatus Paceibacterota bacterium]
MEKDFKTKLIIGATAFFSLFILVYAVFQFKDVIFGIQIQEVNIVDGSTIDQNPLRITGIARHAVYLSLNGREISIDKDGNWDETIALLSGYNIIEIEARDKFGNTDAKNYKLMYPL